MENILKEVKKRSKKLKSFGANVCTEYFENGVKAVLIILEDVILEEESKIKDTLVNRVHAGMERQKKVTKIFEDDKVTIEIENEDSYFADTNVYDGIIIYGKNGSHSEKKFVTDYSCSFTIFCEDFYKQECLLGNERHVVEVIGNIHEK